jgi:hypothetical protein
MTAYAANGAIVTNSKATPEAEYIAYLVFSETSPENSSSFAIAFSVASRGFLMVVEASRQPSTWYVPSELMRRHVLFYSSAEARLKAMARRGGVQKRAEALPLTNQTRRENLAT